MNPGRAYGYKPKIQTVLLCIDPHTGTIRRYQRPGPMLPPKDTHACGLTEELVRQGVTVGDLGQKWFDHYRIHGEML